ncbi:MAG: Rid family detoxifying hydrolase [Rubricoccaceae bacterium]
MNILDAPEAPRAIGPYAHAVRVGPLLFCSGQTPIDPETMQLVEGDIGVQTARVLRNVEHVLHAAGLTLAAVVRTTVYLTSMDDFGAMNAAYAEAFGTHTPARTTVAVRALPLGARVEIECIAEAG